MVRLAVRTVLKKPELKATWLSLRLATVDVNNENLKNKYTFKKIRLFK
jgi:hypothetical protein